MNWWDDPAYDTVRMFYPEPDRDAKTARLPAEVEYDDDKKTWVATPVRVFRGTCLRI